MRQLMYPRSRGSFNNNRNQRAIQQVDPMVTFRPEENSQVSNQKQAQS